MHTNMAGHAHAVLEPRAHVGDAHLQVGKRAEGRRSHQILLASSMTPLRTSRSTVWRYSAQPSKRPGHAGARQLLIGGEAVALEAGVLAFGKGRGGRQHEQVRQEIARLVEEIDAQLVVLDADVDVHAADDQPAADAGRSWAIA
jgi:hypothetical protein